MRARGLTTGIVVGALALASAAPASAADLYVDDSGADPFNPCTAPASPCLSIQQALNQTGADTIHIGGGSYTQAVDINESETLVEDSGFSAAAAGEAILTSPSGEVAVEYFTPGTVQGLTIRSDKTAVRFAAGGSLTGNTFDSSALPSGSYNADVLIDGFGAFSPSITGNTFVDAVPDNQVALVANSTGSPTISGNTFSGFNFAIEALSGAPATPTISGNVITGAHDGGPTGTGIITSGAIVPTITANFIHSPGAGNPVGIDLGSTGSATLSRNRTIGHNIGVRLIGPSSVTMQSDLIVKAASTGLVDTVPLTATNITVVDTVGGSDISVQTGAVLTLDSSIVGAGSSPFGIDKVGTGTCAISDSRGSGDASPCDTGFVSTADPMFVNPVGNDYHLASGSPMIDMGDTAAPPPGTLDVDGDPRALAVAAQCATPPAGRRDIGADEFIAACPPATPAAPAPPSTTSSKKCKKGRKLKKGKCVKRKRKKKRR